MSPMFDELSKWPHALEKGFYRGAQFVADHCSALPTRIHDIVFVGMGGSGIAGRIMTQILARRESVRTHVVEGVSLTVQLRALSRETTLFCVASYSGNTWETLAVLEQAYNEGFFIVSLTHGGVMAAYASDKRVPTINLPTSLTPRSALPDFLGILFGLCDRLGLASLESMILCWATHAVQNKAYFMDQENFAPFVSACKGAHMLHIWGLPHDTDALARRAQTQCNENSKFVAVYGAFPEVVHNLIVGLFQPDNVGHVIILFATDFIEKSLKIALKALENEAHRVGMRLYKPPVLGDTWEEQFFHGMLWADYASCYLGQQTDVALVPVDVIDRYKQQVEFLRAQNTEA